MKKVYHKISASMKTALRMSSSIKLISKQAAFLSVLILTLVYIPVKSQTYTSTKSHTVLRTAQKAGLKQISDFNNAMKSDVSVNIQYYDRLGRPIQVISKEASPAGKDMVSFHEYNADGLELKRYLPYVSVASNGLFRTSMITEQSGFYNAGSVSYGTTSAPWSQMDIEKSPYKRTLEQSGVGAAYQLGGRTTHYEYSLSAASDNVLLWELTASGGLKLSDAVFYAANKLDMVTVKDPQWVVADGNVGTSKTFTDYLGRTILSRNYNTGETYDTYYVYDDFGNVRYVIPPEAVRETINGNADQIDDDQIFTTTQVFPSGNAKNSAYYYMPGVTITLDPTMEFLPGFSLEPYPIDDGFIEQWLYVSTYDTKSQLIAKKIPGADEVHYVYDKSGRLILSQDGNQRLTNQWTFTKYDRLDRPILTGTVTDTRSQGALAAHVATEITATGNKWFEEVGIAVHGYTNRVFPYVSDANDYLVVSYYDEYTFKSSWGSTYNHVTNSVNNDAIETNPLGQETGGKVKELGSDTWLKSVKYYDEDGQLIQSVGDHHLGNIERFYADYNFVGNIVESRLEHVVDGNKTISIADRFEYDHAGRVEEQWHSIDDEPEVLLAANAYNELGESIEINIHSTNNGSTYIQSMDSRYDVQGRLTHINNGQRTNDGITNNDANDQFGMELYYDASPSGLSLDHRYNGVLAGATWSNATMNSIEQRGYAYTYDRSNRLIGAYYKEKDNNLWTTKVGHFDVSINDYDYNGNIERLTRKATVSGVATTIDDLTYSYSGNQLQAVNDATTQTAGFKDGAELSTEYTYDANGNMLTDSNKLITSITYNQLNKPEVVTFSSGDKITYTYDASGARLKQEITVNGTVSQTYDYVGGMLFDEGQLAEVSHSLGRIKVDVVGNDYTYDYQYFLSDHLGNTRAMIAPLERKYVAGMETDRAAQEEAQFLYVSETRYNGQANTGSKSSMLNAAIGKSLGPAKSIRVYNGDRVDMTVEAKYTSTSGVSEISPSNILLTALAASFGGVNGASGEAGSIYTGLESGLTAMNFPLLSNQSPGDIPQAHMAYIFLDSNFSYKSHGFVQVTAQTYTEFVNWFVAPEDGYVFVYLSNSSTLNANVYFDDLVITHTSNDAVLQADDYYPFGLPMNNNFLEAGIRSNRFLYQGKEWQAKLSENSANALNLYDFHARQFDPALGRFISADAANQFASPYLGMGNMPTMMADPDGNFAVLGSLILGKIIGGALIGAGISAAVHTASVGFSNGGFQNWDWGQFGKSVGQGALSGATAAGIGEVFGGVGSIAGGTSSIGKEIGRASLHGLTSGGISSLSGREGAFLSGALAGAFGSLSGSYIGAKGFSGASLVGASAISGGIGAELGGGDFLQGAAFGGIVATANHLGHRIQTRGGIDRVYDKWLTRSRRAGKSVSKLGGLSKLKAFKRLVENNGTYDLKNSNTFKSDLRRRLKLGDGDLLPDTFTYRGKGGYQLQDLGNYNFGVIANSAGFSNNFSQFGAGIVQILSGTSSSRFWTGSLGSQLLYGDDPRDAYFIQLGFHHIWN